MAGWRIGAGRWLLRLVVVAMAFALVQVVFVVIDVMLGPEAHLGTALMFGWSGYTYRSGLYDILRNWGLESVLSTDNWFHYPAIVDAALVGIALALGLTTGLIIAGNRHRNWRALVRLSGK
jgi:hypothetical protein